LNGKTILAGRTRDGRRYLVRGYRPMDRPGVRRVCSDTGLLGNPQEPWFEDRELFADMFSRAYTDYEPQAAFVALVDGRVEGYLLGCLDSGKMDRIYRRKIYPSLAVRMSHPAFWIHPVNRKFLLAMRRSKKKRELDFDRELLFREYPAHLHINIAEPALRGVGIGKTLMVAFFDLVRACRVSGIHLGTTSHNRQAVAFYRRMGFEVLFENRFRVYDHVIDDPPLYNLIMGRKIP
jgi:ribosomal protein S18 acetylase RimI-like enzyme